MIWYWYYCYPLFWCAWRSMYSESFHRVRERWLWEMESLRWRCQTETVMWNQRWFCLDHPIAFQKCLSFKTHWDLQGRCSKRGQFSMWLISCLRTFTPPVWRISEDNDLASYIPHKKSRSSLPVQPCPSLPEYLNRPIKQQLRKGF